jgi:uncharacterized protein
MLPASDPSALRAFLEHPSRPAGTLTYHELQGFLFTIVSTPEMIPASEWLPIIFAGEDIDYASVEEAEAVIGQIMVLSNTINASVLDPPTLLPADCPLRDDVLTNFEDEAPIAQWSRGFLHGHQWLEELWAECLPEELEKELDAVLMALSFFSSREIAEIFYSDAATGHQSFKAMADAIHRVVPRAVAQYAHMGRSIAEVLAEPDWEEPERTHHAKIARNGPCPCGSGKKYKKCCEETVH